jgi:hypothetical protein
MFSDEVSLFLTGGTHRVTLETVKFDILLFDIIVCFMH